MKEEKVSGVKSLANAPKGSNLGSGEASHKRQMKTDSAMADIAKASGLTDANKR